MNILLYLHIFLASLSLGCTIGIFISWRRIQSLLREERDVLAILRKAKAPINTTYRPTGRRLK